MWLAIWVILSFLISISLSVFLLRSLAHPDVALTVKVTVFIAWNLAFLVVCLAPLDLDTQLELQVTLYPVWELVYWTTFVLTWFVIPIQQSYFESGHFSFKNKMKEAWKFNMKFYIISGALILIAGAVVAFTSGLHVLDLTGLAMALANTWGLFLMVILLGYGIVDIPRRLWHFGNRPKHIRMLYFNAVENHSEYEDSLERLSETLAMVLATGQKVQNGDDAHLMMCMNTIEKACPVPGTVVPDAHLSGHFSPSKLSVELRDNIIDEEALAQLHYRVKKDNHEHRRSKYQWEHLMERLDQLEQQTNATFTDAPDSNIVDQVQATIHSHVNIHKSARVASVICMAFSVLVLWSEMTLGWDSEYSLFYQVIHVGALFKSNLVQLWTAAAVMGYLAVCAFYSMFQLRLASYYHLHSGGHSEANSLLFNASFLLRVVFPLSINFYSMTTDNSGAGTAFEAVIGQMNIVPLLGTQFNLFVPIVIGAFSLATFLNFYGRVLRILQISRFEDGDHDTDQLVLEGEHLVRRTFRKNRGVIRRSVGSDFAYWRIDA